MNPSDENASPQRRKTSPRPRNSGPGSKKHTPTRPVELDPARQVAFDALQAVAQRNAYVNLVLPQLLKQRKITGRDAALATELTYGTARTQGLLDQIIQHCADRPLSTIDSGVLDALRLGIYQLIRTRIPSHAAVASTVDLVRAGLGTPAAGFANAILRKAAQHDEPGWIDLIAPAPDIDPIGHMATSTAHPKWIAQAFAEALGDRGEKLRAALQADDIRPIVHLAARPGDMTAQELATITGGVPSPYSPYGVRLETGGAPTELEPVRHGFATVQDEGSQLCALALTRAPLTGPDARWLDLCAGPGGKAALLGALAAIAGTTVDAVEKAPHRAELVKQAVTGLPVTVHIGDGRDPELLNPGYDRILVDAPCTGLGALRRRQEARWRKQPSDIPNLAKLQRELLTSALSLVRPGGVVAYVVCTPHLSETVAVVGDVVRKTGAIQLDTRTAFPGVPELGEGPYVQLWPHLHGTDAMFCALLRRPH